MLRPSRWTLAVRLVVLTLVALILCTSFGGWILRDQLRGAVLRGFENGLRDQSQRLQAEVGTAGVLALRSARMEQGDFGRIFSGWYWVLGSGTESIRSRSLWDSTLDITTVRPAWGDSALFAQRGPQEEPLLGLQVPVVVDGEQLDLYVFGPAREVHQEWHDIDRTLLLTQLGLVVVLGLLCALAVRLGLQPVRQLRAQLTRVQRGTLQRLGQHYGPDLDPLAEAMDKVLQGHAKAVERARNQAADLSHALKKPLAVLSLETQQASVPGYQRHQHVEAMAQTFARHLARLGSGLGSPLGATGQPVNVLAIMDRLLQVMRQIHANRGLDWVFVPPSDASASWLGEASDLEEMVGNLLDNAGKWARGRVDIVMALEAGQLSVQIDDDGPGLAKEHLEMVAQRGRRFDERPNGHGLGLAIVADLTELYGGQFRLAQSPLGGLRCSLKLPG